MEYDDTPSEVVAAHKKALNEGDWLVIDQETNARVLTTLLLDWLRHLREPVLTEDEARGIISEQHAWAMAATLSPASRAITYCFANLVRSFSSTAMSYRMQLCCTLMAAITPNTIHGAYDTTAQEEESNAFTDLKLNSITLTPKLKTLARFLLSLADAVEISPTITPRTVPQRLETRSRSSSLILARALRRPSVNSTPSTPRAISSLIPIRSENNSL